MHVFQNCVDSDLVQAHLENVHDMQSGISSITWWAGTNPEDEDIFSEQISHSHTVLQHTLNSVLSAGTTVYVTVKVCNNAGTFCVFIFTVNQFWYIMLDNLRGCTSYYVLAGICSQTCSDGSTVDSTKPVIHSVKLNPSMGVFRENYLVCCIDINTSYTFHQGL